MRFLLILLALSAAHADTVVVETGDRLNGEIRKLEDGKLHLDTSYAGSILIEWEKITEIISDSAYQLETETGHRLQGTIHLRNGNIRIVGDEVEEEAPASLVTKIVRLEDNKPPGFWKTLDGTVGLGYSFGHGNSDQTQVALSGRADYRQDHYAIHGDLDSIFATLDDAERQSRHALNTRYDRFLSSRVFAFGLVALERNFRQRLDLRSRLGGGFGWNLVKDRKSTFDVLTGFTWTNEQFRTEEGENLPRSNTGEGLFGFEWKSSALWGVRLSTRLTAHPNLVETGRYRIEYDSEVRIPLVAGFTWNFRLFDRFDSRPPQANILRNDYGMLSTLGFSF